MSENQNNKATPVMQLEAILGFNPAKEPGVSKSAIDDVVAELAKERSEKAKQVAKGFITQAIGLAQQRAKVVREFNKQVEQFDKEIQKIMNRLRAAVDGRPAPTEENEGETKAES